MNYKFIIVLGLILLTYEQYFLEKDIGNKYNEMEEHLGLKENKCNVPYKSEPHLADPGCKKLGQCSGTCQASQAIHQVLAKFGITDYSEYVIDIFFKFVTDFHDSFIKVVKGINTKKETNISFTWKNFTSFEVSDSKRFEEIAKIICQSNKDVVIFDLYKNKWGHFETISGIVVANHKATVLNNLGSKKTKGYDGFIEQRSFATFAKYISDVSQASIGIFIKIFLYFKFNFGSIFL